MTKPPPTHASYTALWIAVTVITIAFVALVAWMVAP